MAASPAMPAAPGRLGYFYQGKLGAKLAVHLYVLPEDHARLYRQYRYQGRGEPIGLTGQRRANGEVLLREYTNEAAPQRPTAEFRLAL